MDPDTGAICNCHISRTIKFSAGGNPQDGPANLQPKVGGKVDYNAAVPVPTPAR